MLNDKQRENEMNSTESVRKLSGCIVETISLAASVGDFELVKRLAELAEKLAPAPTNVVPLRGGKK